MTPEALRARLSALGLSQAEFAREVGRLAEEEFSVRNVHNWAIGRRSIPATVPALLSLMKRVQPSREATE